MSARQREFFERQRAASSISNPSLNCFVATVVDYRADGKGAAVVWVDQPHADDANQRLGPIPIMADWAGANYGSGTGPSSGALAVVMNLSRDGDDFIVLGFLHSKPEPSPKVPQGERWMVHKNGSYAKIVNDGTTVGDKLGGNKTGGGDYVETKTRSGHSDVFSDTTQTAVRAMADGSQTVHDAVAHEVSHLAANVTLGARAAAMSAVNAALNKSHLTSYETNRQASNLADLIANANLDASLGIITGAQLTAKLAALIAGFCSKITLPGGSSIVKIAN